MESPTPLKAQSDEGAYPLEPFAYKLPDGTEAGAMYSDPQYQPGTPEYTLRSNDQFKAVNESLFRSFNQATAASRGDAAAILDRKDENAANPAFRQFINNIGSALPEGSTPDDASWYVLNTLRPQVRHDAKYVFGKIRPIIQAKMDEAEKSGGVFYPADMNNDEILGIAKQAGVNPWVVARMAAEEGEAFSRKATKTYTMGVLRPMIDMLDINTQYGQQVYNDPIKELAGLTGQPRRDAFLAMARWKQYHGESFLGSIVEGIGTLIAEGGYAVGGFVEGGVGTMVAVGTGGQVLMEGENTVLSKAWIQKPKEAQDEANGVLQRAHEIAKKYGPELARAAKESPEAFAATLNGRFGEYADKDEIATFQRLSELKNQGAFRSQMRAERLANFGEGVLNAAPNMVKLFNSSIDPNSWFFRTEDNLKNNPVNLYMIGGMPVTGVRNAYEGWVKGTETYKQMTAARLDKSIDLFLENYRDVQGDGESMTGFFFRKGADVVESTIGIGVLSRSLRESENASRNIFQEKELIQAGALADPVMTVLGGLKLLGVGAKAAAAQKSLAGIRAGIQEVTAEAVALRSSANVTSKAFDAAVAEVQLELKNLGFTMTDDEVIGYAIGDRKSIIGKSAAAQRIRTDIGRTIAKNKSATNKLKSLTAQLDELPDDVAGIEKLRARPVGGSVVQGGGYLAQGASVPFNAVADLLDVERSTAKGYTIRRMMGVGARKILSVPGVTGSASAAFIGATIFSGDVVGAAMLAGGAALGTTGVGFLLRPDTLRLIGGGLARAGRLQKTIGNSVKAGKQYGESTFLRGAIDLEDEARKIFETVPMGKGIIRTAEQEAALAKAALLSEDAQILRRMHGAGIEDAMMTTGRVVWEDGLVSGGTGALIAGLNDNDAIGAGAGMGIGFSATFRGLNRLHQITPKGADPVHARVILGDVVTIAQEIKDPAQRANMLSFLGDSGADSAGYIRRAGIVRDLYMSTRGQVRFVRGTEFEAATVLTGSPEVEANMIMTEAAAIHPGDPVKALEYAKDRAAKLKAAREAKDRATHLNSKVEENLANRDEINRKIAALDPKIAELQKIVEDEKVNWTKVKKADANKIKLDRLLEQKSKLEAERTLTEHQNTVLKGEYEAAIGESKVEIPFRPYESRQMPNGQTVRSVASGFYIVDGPQGKSVYVNIDSIDNIAAVSEGMHALLGDSAAEALMPDMVKMLLSEKGDSSGRAVPPQITDAILTAYADSLSPAQKAKFNADKTNGLDLLNKSGGKDTSGVVEPLREAMTWMLAAVDLAKRPGYRPGLATVEGQMAPAVGWDAISKTIFGERTLADNVKTGLRNLFDPVYGSFSRKNAASIVTQLDAAGMRFVQSGDGTLRGYFLNENNEIVRSAVLDAFYDRLIDKTGGKGSNLIRPINLYDPMIPTEARIDFVKRNGMDWVLNDNGQIMTPEQIGAKADGFIRSMEDGLNAIPEADRGMEVYTDPDGNVIRTGIPSQVEIAAIANNPNVPQSIKDNFLTILKTIGSGETKSVLTGDYSNIFSVNVEAITAHRLRVGKDIAGKTETRHIIPLAFTMGDAPIYDAKGNKVRIKDPVTGKMVDAKQRSVRVHGFDTQAFQRSVNESFSGGLYILDDAGKRSYLKDPTGKEYTATYLRTLFGTDADFHNAAALWMNHYYKAGPLDPTAAVPTKDGSPRQNNPVSADVLDPINPVRGAAMRDALRIIFQLESGKKRLGWVEANRQTNTANGVVIRGTNFPLTDFRLEQFGPLKPNGQSMPIDQRGITSGGFVMGVKGWGSQKPLIINGVSSMSVKTVFEAGENKWLGGNDVNVTEVRIHPNLPDVKIFVGYEVAAGTKQKVRTIAYTLGDGRIINTNSSDMKLAISEIRKRTASREDALYVDSILNQWRYERDKPLAATRAAAPKDTGPTNVDTIPRNGADMLSTLQGLYAAEAGGKDIPPSLRKFLVEENVEADIANGKSLSDIIRRLREDVKGRMDRTSSVYLAAEKEKYRALIDHLDTAGSLVSTSSRKYRAAYEVPTKDLRTDTIRTVFDLGRPTNAVGGWSEEGLIANELFNVSKEFASDQFTNNREYLEAVVGNLEGKMNAAENLDSLDAYKAEKARIEPALKAAERALDKLKKDAPELWEAKPDAAAPDTTAPEIIAAEAEQAAGRDVQPRAGGSYEPGDEKLPVNEKLRQSQLTEGTTRDAPYMTPEEIAATQEFRVGPDGKITRITEPERTERQRWLERYNAILKKRKADAADLKKTLSENEKRRKALVNQVRDKAEAEIKDIEQRAADWRKQAQQKAAADAAEAARLQKEADKAQAIADAKRLAFDTAYAEAQATAAEKAAKTKQLVDTLLASDQPLVSPGLLMVDMNRLAVNFERGVNVTDTAVIPYATKRTNVVYLRNVTGFETNIQNFNKSMFNYMYADKIGRGQAIAGEAFRGPMAAQQGINLLNSRLWVAEKSGGRLLREYKNADKAAGRDIVTYKVYGANGMLLKQTNDAADAVEAIENLERRFINSAGVGVLKPDPLEMSGQALDAMSLSPATGRPKGRVQKTEEDTMRIQNMERYRGMKLAE